MGAMVWVVDTVTSSWYSRDIGQWATLCCGQCALKFCLWVSENGFPCNCKTMIAGNELTWIDMKWIVPSPQFVYSSITVFLIFSEPTLPNIFARRVPIFWVGSMVILKKRIYWSFASFGTFQYIFWCICLDSSIDSSSIIINHPHWVRGKSLFPKSGKTCLLTNKRVI